MGFYSYLYKDEWPEIENLKNQAYVNRESFSMQYENALIVVKYIMGKKNLIMI